MPATRHRSRTVSLALLCSALIVLPTACSAPAPRHPRPRPRQGEGVIALIDGRAVEADAIESDLYERAGPAALTEFVLDRELEREITARGITITKDDIAREQADLAGTLDAMGDRIPSAAVLGSLRAGRGLGPVRYERLLRRNAMLRALVGEHPPTEAEVRLAESIAFGPRYTIRLFVSDDPAIAAGVRTRTNGADADARRWVFADACSTRSTHPSASRGGLITGFSPDDPGYPAAIRGAVRTTAPGACSAVVATHAGAALVLVQERTPASPPDEAQRESVRQQLSRRKQRLAMERLADELVARVPVVVMDRSLNWSWSNAR